MKKFALWMMPLLGMGGANLSADIGTNSLIALQTGGFIADQSDQEGGYSNSATMGEITPAVPPITSCWAEPFVTGEFIYWKAVEENLHYAYQGAATNALFNSIGGKVMIPSFNYKPGFKLGFGFKFRHDSWDLYANWTWLEEFRGRSTVQAVPNNGAQALLHSSLPLVPYLAQINFDHGNAKWHMQFNALDLEMGRNFYISSSLTLRPHLGFKFGWIDQKYVANAGGVLLFGPASNAMGNITQDFSGFGIRVGVDTVWYFVKHCGVYGSVAFTNMWGDFDSRRFDVVTIPGSLPAPLTSVKYRRHSKVVTPIIETEIGLRFDTTFYREKFGFFLQAGWEEQVWFDQNQFLDTVDMRTGNLTFEGLSLKTGLTF